MGKITIINQILLQIIGDRCCASRKQIFWGNFHIEIASRDKLRSTPAGTIKNWRQSRRAQDRPGQPACMLKTVQTLIAAHAASIMVRLAPPMDELIDELIDESINKLILAARACGQLDALALPRLTLPFSFVTSCHLIILEKRHAIYLC